MERRNRLSLEGFQARCVTLAIGRRLTIGYYRGRQAGASRNPGPADGGDETPMTKFYDRASDVVRRIYEKRIDAPAVLDAPIDFPNSRKFVAKWEQIRDEAIAAKLESMPRFHDIMPEQADISANDGKDWRMLILKAYGVEVPENCARMPTLEAPSRRVHRRSSRRRSPSSPRESTFPATAAPSAASCASISASESRRNRAAARRRS